LEFGLADQGACQAKVITLRAAPVCRLSGSLKLGAFVFGFACPIICRIAADDPGARFSRQTSSRFQDFMFRNMKFLQAARGLAGEARARSSAAMRQMMGRQNRKRRPPSFREPESLQTGAAP